MELFIAILGGLLGGMITIVAVGVILMGDDPEGDDYE